jgi:hypothetical protein
MDYSQYLRLKQEAANVYVARNKTVDASFLTMQKQQKAAYSGYANIQATPYYNGAPVVYPIIDPTRVDISSCSIKRPFTQGFTATNRLSQQQDVAFRKAGCAVCNDADYSTAPPGLELKNCSEVSTILTEYTISTDPGGPKAYGYGLVPGVWPAYGSGQNTYFPNPDRNSQSTCCVVNKYPFPSG